MAITFNAIATQNGAYKAQRKMKPAGFVLHSTGSNNPNLRRYVNSPAVCGENIYQNYFDTPNSKVCPHIVIGKDIKGKVRAAKLLPYNICCWCAGSGSKGSYNYDPAYIQIEIAEDGLDDEMYFKQAFSLAARLIHSLSKSYGISVDKVVSHKEAHALGYASNHGDPDHWLAKFGKNMDWFRALVSNGGKIEDKVLVTATKKISPSDVSATVLQLKSLGFDVTTSK